MDPEGLSGLPPRLHPVMAYAFGLWGALFAFALPWATHGLTIVHRGVLAWHAARDRLRPAARAGAPQGPHAPASFLPSGHVVPAYTVYTEGMSAAPAHAFDLAPRRRPHG